MVKLPNTPLRQRIGLDDHRMGFFAEQLRDKGFRNLGWSNGIAEYSPEWGIINSYEFLEIYSTGAGYSIWVSESARVFYERDSS